MCVRETGWGGDYRFLVPAWASFFCSSLSNPLPFSTAPSRDQSHRLLKSAALCCFSAATNLRPHAPHPPSFPVCPPLSSSSSVGVFVSCFSSSFFPSSMGVSRDTSILIPPRRRYARLDLGTGNVRKLLVRHHGLAGRDHVDRLATAPARL